MVAALHRCPAASAKTCRSRPATRARNCQIRVKLHLASMDANVVWNEKMEPRLFEARVHAKQAKAASKLAIEDAVKAFEAFAAAL